MSSDPSTEEKIKNAARTIFMRKGYSATKTRDIAEEAGLNLALLNYYFRSKEKLFQQIMMESLTGFFGNIRHIFMDRDSSLEDKISTLASTYIDQIRQQPDTPMFILSELRAHPDQFVAQVAGEIKLHDSTMFHQLVEKIGIERVNQINPVHIMMNLMSMIIFPYVAKPVLERFGNLEKVQFDSLMEERKKLIPQWIMQMIG